MRRALLAAAFAASLVASAAYAGGWELITGRPEGETLGRVYGSGAQWVKVTSFGGNDQLQFVMGAGNDRLIEDAGPGNDILNAAGGAGTDSLTLIGGTGNDRFRASSGNLPPTGERGNDVIRLVGGAGRDTFTYYASTGKNRAVLDGGGGGGSTARIETSGLRIVVVAKKKVAYQSDGATSADTRVTLVNVPHFKVVGDHGETLFQQ